MLNLTRDLSDCMYLMSNFHLHLNELIEITKREQPIFKLEEE